MGHLRTLLLCAALVALARGPAAADKPAPTDADFSFDVLGDGQPAAKPPPGDLERKVKLRRRMLKWHQGLGFALLGVMAATVVVGTVNYVDKYGRGDSTGDLATPHWVLGAATAGLFTATGLLGAFAPNPYPKALKVDAALLHKVTMILATAGMAVSLILGPVTASQGGQLNQRDLAAGHLAVGWTTFALTATGFLSYVF